MSEEIVIWSIFSEREQPTLLCDSVQTARNLTHTFAKVSAGNLSTTLWSIIEMNYQEIVMNKNQVTGRIKEAEGKVKEVTGKIVGNKSLEEKGKVQKTVGKIEAGYGDLKNDIRKSH
jgi:uncharacterized protein YjbJ (UPF0337 family)